MPGRLQSAGACAHVVKQKLNHALAETQPSATAEAVHEFVIECRHESAMLGEIARTEVARREDQLAGNEPLRVLALN